jgi:hypothetical protein
MRDGGLPATETPVNTTLDDMLGDLQVQISPNLFLFDTYALERCRLGSILSLASYLWVMMEVSTDIVPNQFPTVLIEILSSFFLPLTLFAPLAGLMGG